MLKNAVIIVEGKTDSDKLKSYFNLKTIVCNGSAISTTTLKLIKEVSLNYPIIIFTDPDYQGEKIRKIINNYLDGNCYHAFINKEDAIKNNKVGVAEASKAVLYSALNKLIKFENADQKTLTWTEYLELELDKKQLRIKLCYYFNISLCNNKTLWKRLNLMKLNYKKLKLILKEINNENSGNIR